MPFAGRIESGSACSSRARTSSVHTPVALTTTRARIVTLRPPGVDHGAVDPPVGVAGERRDAAAVGDDCAVPRRGADDGKRQAGIVGGGVVVQVRRSEPLAGHRRQVCERGVAPEPPVPLADPPAAGQVVHPHRRTEAAGDLARDDAVLGEHGDHERQDVDEVRGVLQQALTFVQCLVDESDVTVLEVPQTAVDELGALRRGPAGEVVALDERGAQPPCRGVERDSGARDPATDHEHVERFVAEALEHRRAVERGGGHRADARAGHPRARQRAGTMVRRRPLAMTITYDPKHAAYLDEADVRNELTRVFDVCGGCGGA